MLFRQRNKIILLLFLFAAVLVIPTSFAQTVTTSSTIDEQNQLQQQLAQIQAQIDVYQQELSSIKGQKNTLQNKIKQLQKQQAALNLQIKATTLQITAISNDISDNLVKQQDLQHDIAVVLQQIYQNDDRPLVYSLIANHSIAEAYDQAQSYVKLTDGLNALLGQTKQLKQQLDQQQTDAKNLLSVKTLQQEQLAGSVNDQKNILQQTKGRESSYQAMLSDQQARATAIRSRLYDLLGVSQQITFGEAVKIAQWASQQTGVRASFLLAILTQESNLGKNVGTCNRPGDGPEKSYKVIMNPTRDIPTFLQITSDLGMNPEITPVSCPMRDKRGNRVGWGGAMGPAQFIPSTWMGYKDKVKALTGKAANPWDIRDAFLASAIKLAADGATAQSGEWGAAMRYFSGSTNTRYRFYGDNVVATANQYQGDIDQLAQS